MDTCIRVLMIKSLVVLLYVFLSIRMALPRGGSRKGSESGVDTGGGATSSIVSLKQGGAARQEAMGYLSTKIPRLECFQAK